MLRHRLASLALATGLLFTLSGCFSTCEDGRLFPRLFNSSSRSGPAMDCECHNALSPSVMMDPAAQGPILPGPGANVPIITTVPANQPPQRFNKVPTAPATPYAPSIAN
jgi:hypothetical protein